MKRSRWPVVATIVGSFVLLIALSLMFLQIEVSPSGPGPSRTCGSTFDAAVDRAGWAVWWDQDLHDPHPGNRESLLRTSECPSAANNRVLLASGLVGLGLGALTFGAMSRPLGPSAIAEGSRRLRAIGAAMASVGGLLTFAGVLAVVFLVADADSTLFLYTDRLVVALAGVVVLVPAIALAMAGLALRAIGDHLEAPRVR